METVKEKKIVDIGEWESFLREMTGNLEPYGHYDDRYGDAFDQIDDWLNAQPNLQDVPDTNVGDKWISVNDRLPDKTGKYIVCTAKNAVYCAKYYANGKHFGTEMNTHITHWMPLPKRCSDD